MCLRTQYTITQTQKAAFFFSKDEKEDVINTVMSWPLPVTKLLDLCLQNYWLSFSGHLSFANGLDWPSDGGGA